MKIESCDRPDHMFLLLNRCQDGSVTPWPISSRWRCHSVLYSNYCLVWAAHRREVFKSIWGRIILGNQKENFGASMHTSHDSRNRQKENADIYGCNIEIDNRRSEQAIDSTQVPFWANSFRLWWKSNDAHWESFAKDIVYIENQISYRSLESKVWVFLQTPCQIFFDQFAPIGHSLGHDIHIDIDIRCFIPYC
jgi:hypothetical protein